MATPVNTFTSYDAVGAREDLADYISNIDPHETPFYSNCGKEKATGLYHEWQTDALRAARRNKLLQGGDASPVARGATTRLGNYCQTIGDAISIPDTDATTKKAGRSKEMTYQLLKLGKELRTDLETAMFANYPKTAGAEDEAPEMAGAPAWMTSNISAGTGAAADPTGDGTDARTDGTQVAFSQARLNAVMQAIWRNGGKPKTVYLNDFQQAIAAGFTGSNNQRSVIDASGKKKAEVTNSMQVYMTDFGTVEMQLSRFNRPRDVFVMQDDMWCVATKRPFYEDDLAKTGDSEKKFMRGEFTLVCKNEKSSGMIPDCTTS